MKACDVQSANGEFERPIFAHDVLDFPITEKISKIRENTITENKLCCKDELQIKKFRLKCG